MNRIFRILNTFRAYLSVFTSKADGENVPFVAGFVAVGALLVFGAVWSMTGSGWIAAAGVAGYLGLCGLVAFIRWR